MYAACVLGLRDYVEKTGFPGVLLGLSGGIDSALAAAIAADALGPERVRGVRLPSPFTSQDSLDDAAELAGNMGIRLNTIPLTDIMAAYETAIPGLKGLAHENMQARSRGVVLMSLSNQSGEMLLSTGNKSELAVGYATLYGDMCGGFNPMKDLYKTKVYELSMLRNEWAPDDALGPRRTVIPTRILTKAPTAELKDNQRDQDTLPPYDLLDKILEGFIENERSIEEMIANGFEEAVVREVYRMLHRSEYKRRQAAPGVNVTPKSFGGRARRYPMVNRF
jgi:NAD+ synthase